MRAHLEYVAIGRLMVRKLSKHILQEPKAVGAYVVGHECEYYRSHLTRTVTLNDISPEVVHVGN